MRKKLKTEDKKQSLTITINPVILNKINELYSNRSKYIENLIIKDLIKNKHLIDTDLYQQQKQLKMLLD